MGRRTPRGGGASTSGLVLCEEDSMPDGCFHYKRGTLTDPLKRAENDFDEDHPKVRRTMDPDVAMMRNDALVEKLREEDEQTETDIERRGGYETFEAKVEVVRRGGEKGKRGKESEINEEEEQNQRFCGCTRGECEWSSETAARFDPVRSGGWFYFRTVSVSGVCVPKDESSLRRQSRRARVRGHCSSFFHRKLANRGVVGYIRCIFRCVRLKHANPRKSRR